MLRNSPNRRRSDEKRVRKAAFSAAVIIPSPIVKIRITDATIAAMEMFAWWAHKYIMHGWGWGWHRDHHEPHDNRLEKNDLYAVTFGMIVFVLFIIGHVALVFATGALRNLNHMYAAQGSTDPNAYADNWAGAGIFAGSMLLIIAAWVAGRPLVIAPIAKLFGAVSAR